MRTLLLLPLLIGFATVVTAQHHDHHRDHEPTSADSSRPSAVHQHSDTADVSMMMPHAYSLSLPMTRNGSGTSWQPDASPMYAVMSHDVGSGWQLMLHGSIFLRSTWQNIGKQDKRGGNAVDAPNWIMVMAQRKLGDNDLLSVQAMMSLDRPVMGGDGYPLLFQTGETWNGRSLVDRQHPHDLFAALAVAYTRRMSDDIDITAYVGYPGEPAIGPTAFMHRPSSVSNPDAPLSHHWLDATHIVFGVGTLGFRWSTLKVEGSVFTGKEPDEHRYDFDKPLFDSYSWRVSWAPSRHIVAQVSQGYLTAPEALSTTDVRRTTASVQFAAGSQSAWWSGIVALGHNDAGHGHEEYAVLAEASVDIDGTIPYARAEMVQKSREELGFNESGAHGMIEDIYAVTLGASQRLVTVANIDVAIGGQITMNVIGDSLATFYGGTTPLSGQVYLRFNPKLFGMF